VAAITHRVHDVTGAGDTVAATLAVAIAAGAPMRLAVRLANAAAGEAVQQVGVARVTLDELRRSIMHESDGSASPEP
jgi:D-beta-D-heptose 7-phosphate kinase/D-beta-D-heptose 1-phosphate adenosyltransferase